MSELALTASELRMKDYLVDAVVLKAKICGQWLKWSTVNSRWRRMLGRAAANAVRDVPSKEREGADLAAVRFDAIMQKAANEDGVAHHLGALMAASDFERLAQLATQPEERLPWVGIPALPASYTSLFPRDEITGFGIRFLRV
jgi:hypothetical protein